MHSNYLIIGVYFSLSIIWIYILYNLIASYKSISPDALKVKALVKAFMVFSTAMTIDSIYWTVFNCALCGVLPHSEFIVSVLQESNRVLTIKLFLVIAGIYFVLVIWKKRIEDLALESKEKIEIERLNTRLKEINENLLKFVHVIRDMSEGVFICDLKGKITFSNNAAKNLLGYSDDELDGNNFLFMSQKRSDEEFDKIIKSIIDRGYIEELKINKSSGQTMIISLSASVIKDESDKSLYIAAIFQDITQRKLWEKQLVQTERLASIGNLIDGIAHEINNPLTGISGFAQLLKMNPRCDEEMHKDIDTITRESMRAKEIVTKLMLFSRKQKTQRLEVSINDIIEDTIKLLNYEIKKGKFEFIKNLPPDLPEVIGDYHQYQQVFLNIFTNAIQSVNMNGGDSISVTTRKTDSNLIVEISDTGPGIKPENLNRVFDPFFTTKEVGEGTGLGLSVSYGIINQYKGKIYAESEPGKGATFFLEFPLDK